MTKEEAIKDFKKNTCVRCEYFIECVMNGAIDENIGVITGHNREGTEVDYGVYCVYRKEVDYECINKGV